MKKNKALLLIFGLLLFIIPFLINIYSIIRLISVLIGIILITLSIALNKKNNLIKIFFVPIILISFLFVFDYVGADLFKMLPIISVKYKSSQKVNVYNSLFYRVYECDGIRTFDSGYKKNFCCKKNLLKTISINTFMENPKESFKKYHNKFIHIEGKINTIIGNSSLSLNPYSDPIELNGYTTFDGNKKVVIDNLNIDPKDYYIYDFIEIIGLVNSYSEKDDIIEVHLTEPIIIDSDLYKSYEVLTNNIDDNELVQTGDNYYLGIEGIYYKYDENTIYELGYLISDKRESIDNLTNNIEPTEIDDNKLYELEDYNIIICKNDKTIFANKRITNLPDYCKEKNDE